QLQYAHLALRANKPDLARRALDRCQSLASKCNLDPFPFAPKLDTPQLPIMSLLPEHASRAAKAMGNLCDNETDPGAYYAYDPRLFHPHAYFIRTEGGADFHRAGSLSLAIPHGRRFVPEDVLDKSYEIVRLGESIDDLGFEIKGTRRPMPKLARPIENGST